MQEQISDNIVRKIQLLLALAERTKGNEVEAAAAMSRAQELLAKYNLDLSTVQDTAVAGGTNTPEDALAKRDYAKGSRSALYQWQRNLVRAIAEANYCRYWHVKELCGKPERLRNRHKVLGRTANTTVVLVMVDYLFDTIERLLPAEYAELGRRSQEASLWREGCAARLIERIEEKAEAMQKADYAAQGEAAYSSAIAIRTMSDGEAAANYDHINGKGAWAQKLAYDAGREERMAGWAKEREAREAKELAELEAKLLSETPEEKAKREKREAKEQERQDRANERYWNAAWNRSSKESSRRSSSAFAAGSRAGEKIGLDAQLKARRKADELNG